MTPKAVLPRSRRRATVILFIDELHTLVRVREAEGALDASNMLKEPALVEDARVELHCIARPRSYSTRPKNI